MVTGLAASAALASAPKVAARGQKTINPARTSAACMYFPRLRGANMDGSNRASQEGPSGRTTDITRDMNAVEYLIAARGPKCPAQDGAAGNGCMPPIVLAQSSTFTRPLLLIAAMPTISRGNVLLRADRAIEFTNRNWDSDG
jgi:hypothetical protein